MAAASRPARIPPTTYTHLIYVRPIPAGSECALHGTVCDEVLTWKNTEARLEGIVQVDYSQTRVRAVRGVGVDITTTPRRKEISLVVFNPIFIAFLPPSPRLAGGDIVEAPSSPATANGSRINQRRKGGDLPIFAGEKCFAILDAGSREPLNQSADVPRRG